MKARELRQKSTAELEQHLDALLREQFNLRMQKGTGQLSRPSQLKTVKREIARTLTLIRENA